MARLDPRVLATEWSDRTPRGERGAANTFFCNPEQNKDRPDLDPQALTGLDRSGQDWTQTDSPPDTQKRTKSRFCFSDPWDSIAN